MDSTQEAFAGDNPMVVSPMSDAEDFVQHLAALDVAVYTAAPGAGEFTGRPAGWSTLTTAANAARIAGWRGGDALCGLMGGRVAVVDVDPRNRGDVDAVRAALDGIGARIYGDVLTPGGGRHFYLAGHPDLPTCHKLQGFAGVDVQSYGAVAYLPGTQRPKYEGAGYVVMADNLAALADGGDEDSAEALAGWVAEHRAGQRETFEPAAPWTGVPPDRRQATYLAATLRNLAARIASMGPGSGRNVALYEAGLACGNYVAGAGMDEAEATEVLTEAATVCGLVADDGELSVLASIGSGLRNGKVRPRAVPDAARSDARPLEVPTVNLDVDTATGELLESVVPARSTQVDNLAAVLRRFPRLDLAALLKTDRPPREWVISGLLPAGASAALVGPAGSGKSLLLLAAMMAVARGDRTFAGLPITSRRVLLIDMENTEDDLADRFASLGVTPESVAELNQLVVVHLPPLAPLDTITGGQEMAAILDAYAMRPGDVVVLDSMQRVTSGPENDSDTMRAYYRCTGLLLKSRGMTVIRTDNTGKDAEKGARGSSGKRDDVDVELILTADAEKRGRLYLKPGKVRLPNIARLTFNSGPDEDGHLTYTSSGDPFRAVVDDARALLDQLAIPTDAGVNKTFDAIKLAGHKVTRAALRAAITERRNAPFPHADSPRHGCSEDSPSEPVPEEFDTAWHDPPDSADLSVNARAEHDGTGAAREGAPVFAAGAPLSSLSKERHTGTPDPGPEEKFDQIGGLLTPTEDVCPDCAELLGSGPADDCGCPDLHEGAA